MKIITAHQAIDTYIKDGMTLGLGGFVGAAHPESSVWSQTTSWWPITCLRA